MSEAILTPQDSSPSTADIPDSEIILAIDDLLERYLNLLDEQQSLQEKLGQHFSAGFFSLARANHSCPPGRRYGEDYYDERMKATRQLAITTPNTSPPNKPFKKQKHEEKIETLLQSAKTKGTGPTFEITNVSTSKQKPTDNTGENKEDTSPETSSTASSTDDSEPSKSSKRKSKEHKPFRNPLHWFGILVPPTLRSAQQSFSCAIDGPVIRLASVVTEMREVEEKVQTLRKLLVVE